MTREQQRRQFEAKMALLQISRVERRRAAAAERRRLLHLHGIGATSIDEQRLLFPTRIPHH